MPTAVLSPTPVPTFDRDCTLPSPLSHDPLLLQNKKLVQLRRQNHPPDSGPFSPSPVAEGKCRSSSISARRSGFLLGSALSIPPALSLILSQAPWDDFHALMSTCSDARRIITHPRTRDIILSLYVPGYHACLQNSDPALYREVQIDFHDLSLFLISQSLPLHKFPVHALSLFSSPSPPTASSEWPDRLTARYVALAQAHSRIILLLQSLVHSNPTPLPPDEFDDNGSWIPSCSAQPAPGVRELVFPAPLSYFNAGCDHGSALENMPPPAGKRRLKRPSSASTYVFNSSMRASGDFQSLMNTASKSRSRTSSLFGSGMKAPPPPPSFSPPAIKYYSSGWRRSLAMRRSEDMNSRSVSDNEGNGSVSMLKRPRQFASADHSSNSSLSSPTPSSSRSQTEHVETPTRRIRFSLAGHSQGPLAISTPQSSSPHDLYTATSRNRAPLIRVFVPCTQLDEPAICACEEQLIDAGLWEHLSTGDIVCNFGFVPPPESDADLQRSPTGTSADAHPSGMGTTHRRRWLIFNGYCLVHFIPPSAPPIENPLMLPSPYYYAHILPPTANPVYIMSLPKLPPRTPASPSSPTGKDSPVQITLTHVSTRVYSPHSPMGYAVVKRYVWLARVAYADAECVAEGGAAIGEGWRGVWVLEAEGTKEGRQYLVEAVRGGGVVGAKRGQWEVVKAKSGAGKLWMRLLNANVDPSGIDLDEHQPRDDTPRT